VTPNRLLAIAAIILAVASYFISGPLLIIAVICVALALLV
jgi:hypothetical protein